MLNDLKFALRRLRHSPGYAATAILTIAVAIGASTAILSFADAVLFRPLPYGDAERLSLLMLGDRVSGRRGTLVPYDYLAAIDSQHTTMSATGRWETGPSVLEETPTGVRSVSTLQASPNYFDVLGVSAAIGRTFTSDDAANSGRAAMLTYGSWRARFGGDPAIAGKAITIGARTFDVVGVLPRDFLFPGNPGQVRTPEIVTMLPPPAPTSRGGLFYPAVRLADGVSRERAQAELDAIGARIGDTDPRRATARPVLVDLREAMYGFGAPIIRLLLAASLLVLLLACANLANAMLARNRGFERATAIMASLGASRAALMRPVVLEALLLCAAGSTLGIAVNAIFFDTLATTVPRVAYGNAPVGVDLRVIAIAGVLGITASLAFAILPAWRASRTGAQAVLQQRSAGSTSRIAMIGRPMVVVQVALAIALIFGAVVTARAFVSVLKTPLGFDPANVATVDFALPRGLTDVRGFFKAAIGAIAARGDVEAVGAIGSIPISGGAAPYEGAKSADGGDATIGVIHTFPGFFEAARVPVLKGRALSWEDAVTADAIVLSESGARTLFGAQEPVGRLVSNSGGTSSWRVVGVVADIRTSVDRVDRPISYALPGERTTFHSIVVRTRDRRAGLLDELKRSVQPLVPGQVVEARWWDDTILATTPYKNPRFQAIVLGAFAAIALGLTALGLFGLVSFLVASRTRELGIRLAIGASPRSLVMLTMRQMFWPVAIGLVSGLLATRLLAKLAEAQLFKVETRDPATLAIATVVVVISAMIAAYLPARRAERIDPIVALRAE